MAITFRQNELESCSNPLKTREDVQFRLQKNTLACDLSFCVDVYIMRGCNKTALSFSAGCLRNLLPSFAPISLQ